MRSNNDFGCFAKEKRLSLGVSLREFCRQNSLDWGHLSKVERGKASPPKSPEVLAKYAHALGIREGSDDWQAFHDLAAISAGSIPREIMEEGELVAQLPLVFRTIRGQKLTPEQLGELAEMIREA